MDLQFLRPLYEDFGGYVSVYLDTSLAAVDGGQAGDPVAGDSVAGDPVAGDPVARTLLVRQLDPDLAAITVVIEQEVTADSEQAARAAGQAVA